MKKILASLLIAAVAPSAFASHPHDRVCVSSAPYDFIFQYSVGRTYQQGNTNKDPRKIAVEASRSFSDYMAAPSTKYSSAAVVQAPNDSWIIPVMLISSKYEVLFKGTFDVANETLVGEFADNQGQVTSKLTCISQPRTTLQTSQVEIAQ